MSNLLKAVLSGAALTGAAALLMAGAILHPEMKVETGTYEAPAAELANSLCSSLGERLQRRALDL